MSKVNASKYALAQKLIGAGRWRVDPAVGLVNPDGKIAGCLSHHGYLQVGFRYNGAPKVVVFAHRVVCEYAYGPIPDGLDVNHIDGDKANNALDNLELVTHAQNMAHAKATGLARGPGSTPERDARAVAIYRAAWHSGDSCVAIAARHGVTESYVSKVKHGRLSALATGHTPPVVR